MSKIAGEFLNTFTTWRDAKIAAFNPNIPKLDGNTLKAQDYFALTTFNPNTKIDIVKERADKYFIDICTYFQCDLGLAALGIAKPKLSADIQEIVQEEKVAKFFTEYAKLMLLQTIYGLDEASGYKSSIRGGAVDSELNSIAANSTFSRITMMLYFISLKELYPKFLPYIYHHSIFNPKVRPFLLDAAKVNKWVQDAVTFQVANVENEFEFDTYRFQELKTKLDLLQPNLILGVEILQVYIYTTLAFYATGNLRNSPLNRGLFYGTIEKIIKRIEKVPTNQFLPAINKLKTAFGGTVQTASTALANLFYRLSLENPPVVTVVPATVVNQATALSIKKETLDSTFESFKADALFLKFANALLNCCHVSALSYGILNPKNLAEFDIGLMFCPQEAFYLERYVDGAASTRVYTVMAEFLNVVYKKQALKEEGPQFLLSSFGAFIPQVFSNSTMGLAKKLIPSLFCLGRDFSTYYTLTNSKVARLGSYALRVDKLNPTQLAGLCRIYLDASYSGPSLPLTIGGYLFSLKINRNLNDELIKAIGTITDDTPVDPISAFIASTGEFYIDYSQTNADTSEWESTYESLTEESKASVDILVKP